MNEGTPIIIKRKRATTHRHHGGSWKVAYADFVTAMMAFFMVMWILGMSDDQRSVIAAYFKDPVGFAKNQPSSRFTINPMPSASMSTDPGESSASLSAMRADEERIRQLERRIETSLDETPHLRALVESVEVTVTREGLRIELVETTRSVFFETGRAAIRPDAMRLIAKIGPILGESDRKLVIEGHTDARPYPSENYSNVDLSFDRARAVWSALRANGVRLAQYGEMRAMADRHLKVPNDPYSSLNRRVTILLPFDDPALGELPADDLHQEISYEVQPRLRNPVEVAPPRPANAAAR